MDEKQAKKLGEVLAFASVGNATLEKANEAAREAFGIEEVDKLAAVNTDHMDRINSLADDLEVYKIVEAKHMKTSEKLTKMRDMYIGDDWDDPIELMEWMGFFEGAAIIHWALIDGVAKQIKNEELEELAKDASGFHTELLEVVGENIKKV